MAASSPNWFGRNWKWFVPAGCLTLLLLVVGVGAILGYGALRMYEGSGMAEPRRDALAAAKASPALKHALGEPMEMGVMMSGQININNEHGRADVSFPIHGPRGKGRVYVVGEMTRGRWAYSVLQAQVEGQSKPIELRHQTPDGPSGP